MLKSDCIYFDYEEDMGKSVPYCKVKKHRGTPCMCDMESNYIDDCDNCDRYVRTDYVFLKSIVNERKNENSLKEKNNGLREN